MLSRVIGNLETLPGNSISASNCVCLGITRINRWRLETNLKFDTSTEAIKRKNRISDQSEIWMGRVILVPERKGKNSQNLSGA